jgi:small subunit ribosomal protein S9
MINGKEIANYVSRTDLFDVIYTPLRVTKLKDSFYIEVKVAGSGESSQAGAIRHGIARALLLKDESLR